MYITDKYIFTHKNKAAGCTIKDFMIEYMGAKILKYKHAPLRMLPEKYRDKRIKIGCIRNPFSWYVSYYCYHRDNGKFLKMTFDQYINDYVKDSRALLSLMPKKLRKKFPLLYPPRTRMPIGAYTFHYINYFSYNALNILKNWDIEVLKAKIKDVSNLDVTFRTETLQADMIKEFGYSAELKNFPRKNQSKRKPYKEYFNLETQKLVEERDGILLDFLGYEY